MKDEGGRMKEVRGVRDDLIHSSSSILYPSSAARLGRLTRLVRKELAESLRDRRTVITLVLMPLILYPLLSMAFRQFFLVSAVTEPTQNYLIGVSKEEINDIVNYLNFGLRDTGATCAAAVGLGLQPLSGGVHLALLFQTGTTAHVAPTLRRESAEKALLPYPKVIFFEAVDLEHAVRNGGIHVGIRIRHAEYPRRKRPVFAADWELLYDEKSPISREVLRYVEVLCAAANARYMQDRLVEWDIRQRATPVRLFCETVIGIERDEAISLKAVIPLILILMTITGAVYPAIDLTAGERERGTLEILVAAPVPRMALLFAKYVSVVSVAVLTALVNLVMMTVTLHFSGLGHLIFADAGLTPVLVLQIFGLLLLFAAFFSAVLLTLTSFARSFKEAQAYLIPLMLVSLAPGLAGLLPGMKLGGIYTVLPLLNIVLLGRDLLEGQPDLALSAVVVGSTLLYALAALAGAARFFGAEAVLYSEQSGWSDLLRRPSEPQQTATLASALFCLALLFPLLFVLNSVLVAAPSAWRPVYQVIGSLALFVLMPLLSAFLNRVRLDHAFQLRSPRWFVFPAALLLAVSLLPLVAELIAFVRDRGWTFFTREHEEFLRRAVSQMTQAGPVVSALVFALIGVMEEAFFRGYLFGTLRKSRNAITTIAGSAVLFGVFHAVTAIDRFVPSTIMGLVLGWVAWTSRSVLPCMLLHAVYNALIVIVASMPEEFGITDDHFPWLWLVGAVGGVGVGAAIIHLSSNSGAASAVARDRA